MTYTDSGTGLTYDDYLLFPDDGLRHELIGGEHFVSPAPNRPHQAILMNVGGMIWTYLQAHPIGRVYMAPFDIILSTQDIVQPDLVYFSLQRMSELEMDPRVKGAPNLIVEIASPSTRRRDRTTKRLLYGRFGVDEYWIVDPREQRIDVLRRGGSPFRPAAELSLTNRDVLTTPLLPDAQLPLTTIFRE